MWTGCPIRLFGQQTWSQDWDIVVRCQNNSKRHSFGQGMAYHVKCKEIWYVKAGRAWLRRQGEVIRNRHAGGLLWIYFRCVRAPFRVRPVGLLSPTLNAPHCKTKTWNICHQTHSSPLISTSAFLSSVRKCHFQSCLGSPNFKARCVTAARCCRCPHCWCTGNWDPNLQFSSMWPRYHLQFVAIHSNE